MFDDELDKVFCFRRPVWAAERVGRCDLKTDTYTASEESAWSCSLKGWASVLARSVIVGNCGISRMVKL